MSGELLAKIANGRTFAAMVRAGWEVPVGVATALGVGWPVFLEELAAYDLRAEFALDVWVIREGKAKPVTLAEVPGAPNWDDPLING